MTPLILRCFLLVSGRVPVRVGHEVMGAVGAAGEHLDERCAPGALDTVKNLVKYIQILETRP